MEAEELLKKRLQELARKCYQNNQYTFTGFLGPADMECFYGLERELSYVPYKIWGGSEFCERAMLRFGGEQELGYEEDFPIACIAAKPLAAKFADALSHRDFLGALMNLGIDRSTLGDIWIIENMGYIFCLESMADFIAENLGKVKHTSVQCSRTREIPDFAGTDRQEIRIQVASGRIDAVLARVYKLSRSQALELFRQRKVLLNGRNCENNSVSLTQGDRVSARGYGRFDYLGEQSVSKKGKSNAAVIFYGKR